MMVAGLFVDLVQTHSLEELLLNFEVVGIALRKVTKEASRSAIAQRFDQYPNTVIDKFPLTPNLCHNDYPRSCKFHRIIELDLQRRPMTASRRPLHQYIVTDDEEIAPAI
jgi:hypothetical protein